MSDEVFQEELSDEENIEQASHINKPKIEKALRWIIIIALIILVGELIMIFIVNPCLPLSRVEVIGMPELDKKMILEKAGITSRSSYITVNPRIVEKRLQSLVVVDTVKVTKRFPDTVRITLEGRKAIAMSFGTIDGKVYPVFYDKQGLVFMIGNGNQNVAIPPSIPIISGILVEQPFLGMRLPATFNNLLHDLERISSSAPELLAAVSEIQINRNVFDRYDLTLYPVHNKVRIRIGNELTENMLRYVLLVVDVCVSRGVKVEEIDFRTGTASYTIKEASSG